MSNTADMLQRKGVLRVEGITFEKLRVEDIRFEKINLDYIWRRAEDNRKQIQELEKEIISKEMAIKAGRNSPTDKMIDLIEQAIEKRSERIRSTIAEAKININAGDETEIEFYEDRLKNLWSYMEKNIDELTMKYNKPCNILELEDLSFEVTDTLRVLKKQKEMNLEINLKKMDNDFEQAIITTTGREDFKRYFIPRESPHFGGSRVDGCFVTDATMDLEPPDERQNVEMAIKDADDRSMTVEDAVLNPKAKKKKPMACLPIKHIEQLPKEKCSEERIPRYKKEEHIKGKSSSTGKLTTSSRNLWVSGLSSLTRASDLKGIFSKYGKVIGAKVVTNTRTPGTRCYSYVTMSSSSDASRSVAKRRYTTSKWIQQKNMKQEDT
ncbi:SAFB-like transcription modulator [Bactrocera neohumeralis]|uniref:SAFB-like transcription modulator n=1 Tax=Bactrocera neohumeralis TaxID=98809 RepID=UPI0021665D5C|nr:SAFB-like transcription modulator [Bactrocera neohumeralis]